MLILYIMYRETVLYVRSKKAKEPDITIGFLLKKYIIYRPT